MSGDHADVTYNTAWAGFWLLAEISLATVVTCLLSLPKFIEVHGKTFINTFSSFSQPLVSLKKLGFSERRSPERPRVKNTTAAEDTTLDGVVCTRNSSETHLMYDLTDRPLWNESLYPPRDFSHPATKTPISKGR